MSIRDQVVALSSRITQLKTELAAAEAQLDGLLGQPGRAEVRQAARPATPTKQRTSIKRPVIAELVRAALEAAGDVGLPWSDIEAAAGGRDRSMAARSALKQLTGKSLAERTAAGMWRLVPTKKKAPKA